MLKIGVLGVGHLGKIHIKCIQEIEQLFLIGFYDPNDANATKAAETYNIKRFDNMDALINACDILDVVTPTTEHFDCAVKAIKQNKHVFIEKPITHTTAEAEQLIELIQKHAVKVQVGHVERFNPAFLALDASELNPMFIEGHRLSLFNPRGTDVPVVLDLMIHDLDILLSTVPSEVKQISASGVAVISDTADIANARIEFENGCVANLTASRISMKQMRKLRMFQQDAYISLDFLSKQAEVIRLYNEGDPAIPADANLLELTAGNKTKLLHLAQADVQPVNAIKMELETFAACIKNNTEPRVTVEDAYRALKVAHQIMDQIEENIAKIL